MAGKKTERIEAEVNVAKEIRGIARERVGPAPPAKVIKSKKDRKQPKHKRKETEDWQA